MSLSAPDDSIISLIISFRVLSQASVGTQDITCLLGSCADVDYIWTLIYFMRDINLIINCVNCLRVQVCNQATPIN